MLFARATDTKTTLCSLPMQHIKMKGNKVDITQREKRVQTDKVVCPVSIDNPSPRKVTLELLGSFLRSCIRPTPRPVSYPSMKITG